jgi:hypothetical protein
MLHYAEGLIPLAHWLGSSEDSFLPTTRGTHIEPEVSETLRISASQPPEDCVDIQAILESWGKVL